MNKTALATGLTQEEIKKLPPPTKYWMSLSSTFVDSRLLSVRILHEQNSHKTNTQKRHLTNSLFMQIALRTVY